MTPEQTALAREAIGLPNAYGKTWRNACLAKPGTPIHAAWTAMVADGVAYNLGPLGGAEQFSLRRNAAEAVILPGERIVPQNFIGIPA